MTNEVFGSIEGKVNLMPVSEVELAIGVLVGFAVGGLVHPLIGVGVCSAVVGVMMMWRRRDHGRQDYLRAWLRRRPSYNGNEPDPAYRPLAVGSYGSVSVRSYWPVAAERSAGHLQISAGQLVRGEVRDGE